MPREVWQLPEISEDISGLIVRESQPNDKVVLEKLKLLWVKGS